MRTKLTKARRSRPPSVPHPWRRYFARTIDHILVGICLGFFCGLFHLKVRFWLGFLTPLIWSPIEAHLLTRYGNTPGKSMFGLSLKTKDGERLQFTQALKRSLMLWVYGLGFNIPILQIFTGISEFRRVKSGQGTTWDNAMGTQVDED